LTGAERAIRPEFMVIAAADDDTQTHRSSRRNCQLFRHYFLILREIQVLSQNLKTAQNAKINQ